MTITTWIQNPGTLAPDSVHNPNCSNYHTVSFNEVNLQVNLPQLKTQFQRRTFKKFSLAKETKMRAYKFILAYIVRIYLIILTTC